MKSLSHIKNSFIIMISAFLCGCTSLKKCKFTQGTYFLEIPKIGLLEVITINNDLTFSQNSYLRKSGKLTKYTENTGKITSIIDSNGYHEIGFYKFFRNYDIMKPPDSTPLLSKPKEVITRMYFDYDLSGSIILVSDLEYGYIYEIIPVHLIKEISEIETIER